MRQDQWVRRSSHCNLPSVVLPITRKRNYGRHCSYRLHTNRSPLLHPVEKSGTMGIFCSQQPLT